MEFKSTGGVYPEGYQGCCFPTTTNMTKNELFEKQGYLFIPGMVVDPENLHQDPPLTTEGKRFSGQIRYHRKDKATFTAEEQVQGSLSKYNDPRYKGLHYLVRKEIEPILGIDLLPTYYFDRFYYTGQTLLRHSDRQSCEISVTLQISTNSDKPWPIWFERPDGSESCVVMKNGDAVIYKGCEREHWRDPLESKYSKWENRWRTFRNKEDDTYHHQIFLHFVNSQGPFVQFANDAS